MSDDLLAGIPESEWRSHLARMAPPATEDYELEWDDVDMLREVACCPHHSEACKDLADYLATLLPPRGERDNESNTDTVKGKRATNDHTTE
jgi:hypothetical protein